MINIYYKDIDNQMNKFSTYIGQLTKVFRMSYNYTLDCNDHRLEKGLERNERFGHLVEVITGHRYDGFCEYSNRLFRTISENDIEIFIRKFTYMANDFYRAFLNTCKEFDESEEFYNTFFGKECGKQTGEKRKYETILMSGDEHDTDKFIKFINYVTSSVIKEGDTLKELKIENVDLCVKVLEDFGMIFFSYIIPDFKICLNCSANNCSACSEEIISTLKDGLFQL